MAIRFWGMMCKPEWFGSGAIPVWFHTTRLMSDVCGMILEKLYYMSRVGRTTAGDRLARNASRYDWRTCGSTQPTNTRVHCSLVVPQKVQWLHRTTRPIHAARVHSTNNSGSINFGTPLVGGNQSLRAHVGYMDTT